MAVVKCDRGHFFDNEKYAQCPHCAAREGEDDPVTMAMEREAVEEYAAAYVKSRAPGIHVPADPQRTAGIKEQTGARNIAGWLVCVDGEDRGKDYPLYAGFNRVGRGASNDIVVRGDREIAREEHCSVVYEQKKNLFYLVPKAGSLTYLDERLAERAQEIETGQIISLGSIRLEFIAYCRGEKKWENKR